MLIQLRSFGLEFRLYGPLGFDGFCSKINLTLYLGMLHFWKHGGLGLRYLTKTIVQVYFHAGMEQTCFLNRSYENCASVCNFFISGTWLKMCERISEKWRNKSVQIA